MTWTDNLFSKWMEKWETFLKVKSTNPFHFQDFQCVSILVLDMDNNLLSKRMKKWGNILKSQVCKSISFLRSSMYLYLFCDMDRRSSFQMDGKMGKKLKVNLQIHFIIKIFKVFLF